MEDKNACRKGIIRNYQLGIVNSKVLMDKIDLTVNDISAVILAGGAGTRFGSRNKLQSLIGGKRIIDRVTDTLSTVFDEIIIVTNNPEEFIDNKSFQVTVDQFRGAGPLGGIHAAMMVSARKALFVFAGDMPYLVGSLIREQISFAKAHGSDAVIPEINGGIEPLHGIYMNRLAGKIENQLSAGKDLSLRGFLSTINVVLFRPENSDRVLKAFVNINWPGDADKYRQYRQ
jgi:molybdopterin-guanine dinucleotide biosynthesis protein A